MQSQTKFFIQTVKLMEYIFSAVSVCSDPCFGPFPRTNMFFFNYQYEQKTSFNRRSSFSFPGGGFGQNILIFGVDQTSHSLVVDLVKIY